MGIPEIVMIAMWAMGLGCAIAEHGKYKTGKNNFFATLIATVIEGVLLYWGGFFK